MRRTPKARIGQARALLRRPRPAGRGARTLKSEAEVRSELRGWIVSHARAPVAGLTDQTPLLEQGIVSSLDAVELVLFIESLRGDEVDTDAVEAEVFRSIDALYAGFFGGVQRDAGALQALKRGGPRNLFLVHDGDGDTLLYMNVARRMPKDVSVFGIEPRRMPGVPLAHVRIEDMASAYLEEVRKQQPHGPYLLGGMCAGGTIAYEMAAQLTRAGERVELVALLDAATPQAPKRVGRITKQRFTRLREALAQLRASEILHKLRNALTWEAVRFVKRWSTAARFRLLHAVLARQRPWPSFVPTLSVREIYESAEARYVPKQVDDAGVLLVRARVGKAEDTPFREIYADDTLGWGAVAGSLAVVDVEGGHSSMLQEPHAESLAAVLLPRLVPAQPV